MSNNICFKIETEDKIALEEFAKKNDLKVSQVLRRAVKSYLKNEDNKT